MFPASTENTGTCILSPQALFITCELAERTPEKLSKSPALYPLPGLRPQQLGLTLNPGSESNSLENDRPDPCAPAPFVG